MGNPSVFRSSTVVRRLVLVVLLGSLATPAWASEKDYGAAIPAGQEDLMAGMLGKGRDLPGDCKLRDSSANYSVIDAVYECAGKDVVLELTHPSHGGAGATQTAKFNIRVESGAPPDGLLRTVVPIVRARESAFQWLWLGRESDPGDRVGTFGGEPLSGN